MAGYGIEEKKLRARALSEAAELYRSHGDSALRLLSERGLDPLASEQDRRRYRLSRIEIERLDRLRRRGTPNALVVWKPPLFSLAGIAQLFRIGRRRR